MARNLSSRISFVSILMTVIMVALYVVYFKGAPSYIQIGETTVRTVNKHAILFFIATVMNILIIAMSFYKEDKFKWRSLVFFIIAVAFMGSLV